MSAIIYLLQVSACLALFYCFYYIMLNRLTFFTINRYYLLFTLVLSFVIPLLTITVHQQYEAIPVVQQVEYIRSFNNITYYTPAIVDAPIKTENPLTWMQLLKYAYLLAVAGLFTHLLVTLINFFVKLRLRKLSSVGNVHILRGDKNLPNGSFLNYIFLNDDELSPDEMQQIIAHEMLHVKLYHSADRILMKLVQIILWFNPFVYLYARSMEENHEFEVDREIARSTNKNKYADLLLHLSVANQGMLYHSFSKVPLKKRIVMLFNRPSAKVKRVVYILVLPIIVISCVAFANIKKDDIKNFSLVRSTKKIIAAVKTGQENIITQLNTPVQLPVAILNADSVKITAESTKGQSDNILSPAKDSVRYSDVVHLSVPLSAKINVTIDNKQYPSDILYQISRRCIVASSLNVNNNVIDVKLETKDGQIIYMTPHEKENLYLENKTAQLPFYNRRTLTYDNGVHYDFISLNDTIHRRSAMQYVERIEPDDKVGFLIDGKVYSEDEYKALSQPFIASLKRTGSAAYRPDMLYQNKYKVLYTLNSPTYRRPPNNTSGHGGGGVSFYPQLGWFSPNDTAKKTMSFRNFRIAGYPVDTVTYKAKDYKVNPDASLIDLIKQLPNFKIVENAVYVGDKVMNDLYINGKEFSGYVLLGLQGLPVGNVTEIKITSPDPKNRNPAIMYVISK
ncbi:MAG: M56 family metallopeptidase [Mucilaginibacter sp.]